MDEVSSLALITFYPTLLFLLIQNISPSLIGFKIESNRKLSNINFQWTKTLYQNSLNNIALKIEITQSFDGFRVNLSAISF